MKFTHLHVHTQYSLLDGLPKIGQLIDHVKKNNMDSVAITDHGVLYGAVEFYKKAKAAGIKPIIGCEVYVSPDSMHEKRPNIDNKRYHLILLVKNEIGYKNLVKIVTKAHLEGFYYKPRTDKENLFEHSEGLIAMTACLQGQIPRLLLSGQKKEAEKLALEYQGQFGKDSYYLEIQKHPNIPEQDKVNKLLIEMSKKLDIPLVATNDCHYLNKDDAEAQDILMLINTGSKKDDPDRLSMLQDDFSMQGPEEMTKDFKETPEAIENTQKIADLCNFDFILNEIKLPYYETPKGKTANDTLRDMCEESMKTKDVGDKDKAKERLDYELGVINEMGFSSYFLITQDFVNWSKENGVVVGPGRGSVGGSLVAYLVGITNIDPLKHDLLFERFLNPARISMPDIDLDFADLRRDEVLEYVSEKYGKNHVAQIITFGTMAARAALRDVGRVLGINYGTCDKVAKMIPFQFTLDKTLNEIKEFKELYDSDYEIKNLIDIAKKLEGVARHASTHACGVVISKDPLDDLVPLQHPSQDGNIIITQYDMHAVEALGLLKMDFLGLKNLTTIEKTLELIKILRDEDIDIDTIPQDDKKTFKLLQKADTNCVFQLESGGMKRWLKELRPTEFEDISTMLALYRPGPMQFIPEYVARKNKKSKIEYLHPSLEPILKTTYGLPIFQEQMMQIAQVIAGFSLSEADILRKAIGKKIHSLLKEQEQLFVQGAMKKDVPEKIARKIWSWFLPFASYGFNKSHSTGYGMIAYQTAYLKAHYPIEFMASVMASEKQDIERTYFLIEECKKMKIDVLPPDVNESFKNFTVVDKDKIRFGLLAIKNVGHDIVETIVKERKDNGKFGSIGDFLNRIHSKNLNKKSMDALIKTGAFDNLEERGVLLHNLERILAFAKELQNHKNNGQKGLFAATTPNIRLENAEPATMPDRLSWEKELLGIYVSGHPLQNFKLKGVTTIGKIFEDLGLKQDHGINFPSIKKLDPGNRVKVGGLITNIKKIMTKSGRLMQFIKIEDLTGNIEIVVFPGATEKFQHAIVANKIVTVSGRIDLKELMPKILAETIEEVVEL